MNYRLIPTTPEVWRTIMATHDLWPFGAYTDSDGGVVQTSYAFPGADYPLVEAHTTWDADTEQPFRRANEKHRYYLCVPTTDA
jgi:hypothetical protein